MNCKQVFCYWYWTTTACVLALSGWHGAMGNYASAHEGLRNEMLPYGILVQSYGYAGICRGKQNEGVVRVAVVPLWRCICTFVGPAA